MKACEGVEEVWLHEFLTTVLDGDEWSATHACRRTPGGRVPPYACFGCQMFSQVNLQGNVFKFPIHNYRCH
jgi:hypothetical protein